MHSVILVVVFIFSFSHFLLFQSLSCYHSLFVLHKAISVCLHSKLSHNHSFPHFYSSFFPSMYFLRFLPSQFPHIFSPCVFYPFFPPPFLCFLSLRELYGYFLSPFKNNSFFASSVSALALTLSHCLDINLLLACREAKHTDKLNSHVQRKLQLDSLAVTNNLTPH